MVTKLIGVLIAIILILGTALGVQTNRLHGVQWDLTVQDGVTICASATIGSDIVIGRFAMIGMGAVVTRSVPAYTLVIGNPARPVGLVCRCGRQILSLRDGTPPDGPYDCAACSVTYLVEDGAVVRDPLDEVVPAQRLIGRDTLDADAAELAG